MKSLRYFFLAALLASGSLQAQSEVPNRISYQGIVTDMSGNLVGDPTPENRTVIFRIWGDPTAPAEGNLIYSEQQVVTIAKGEFSVLVGAGAALTATPLGFSEAPYGPGTVDLADAFGGSGRYLGVTVDDGTAAADVEISPRQQIVTTAFSFRAKEAESVIGGSIVEAALANSAVTLNKMSSNAVNSDKIVNLSVITEDLSNGAVTKAKLGSDVGFWDVNGGDVYRGTGNVGIGTANPQRSLHVYKGSSGQPASTFASLFLEDDTQNWIQINSPNATGSGISFGRNGTATDAWIQYNSARDMEFRVAAAERMRIAASGNVGIGTPSPSNKLTVAGQADFTGRVGMGTASPLTALHVLSAVSTEISVDSTAATGGKRYTLQSGNTGRFAVIDRDDGVSRFSIESDGKVGIGGAATKAQLEVSGSSAFSFVSTWTEHNNTADVLGGPNGAASNPIGGAQASIYATKDILGQRIFAFSDERIKNIQGVSDGSADLNTLRCIEVTDYLYKDVIGRNSGPQKKVIAQQVERIFPQVVSKHTDVVPDIYKFTTVKDGWVQLETELKKGERVKLITQTSEDIYEVLEVAEGRFRTEFQPAGDKVFVYGREVDDFRSVDYEAIAMLNVSATQELARKQESNDTELARLRSENDAMAKKLAALEEKDRARDARLAAVEELLLSADRPAVRQVSLKPEVAAK